MDKFISYLKKQGVQETAKNSKHDYNVSFVVESCGDNDYFVEAPNFTYKRVCLLFDYNVAENESYFRYLADLERKVRSYAKKYGYIVESCSCYDIRFFYITKAEDAERADHYFSFRDACIRQWEEIDHHFHNTGKFKEYSELSAKVLNRIYSLRYRQFLRSIGE